MHTLTIPYFRGVILLLGVAKSGPTYVSHEL